MVKTVTSGVPTSPIPPSSIPRQGRRSEGTSFDQQLSGALQQYLKSSGIDTGKAQISIAPSTASPKNGAASGTRQFVVTVSDGTAAGSAPPAGRTAATAAPPKATTPASANPPATTPAGKPLPPSLGFLHIIQPDIVIPAKPPVILKTPMDRYWASQPEAVQVLKDMDDPAARRLKAWDLAMQGHTIDVPIMVWGWDPQYTMELRQSYGYTWVPSALQDTVKVAPGLQMPGMPSYDPNHPPPGSIRVQTDFV